MALGWIKGLPPTGTWQRGAFKRGRGHIKWVGHIGVTWKHSASQHMLVVLRSVDNASDDLFAELSNAYLPHYVRGYRDVNQPAFQVDPTRCMIVCSLIEKITLQDPRCGSLLVSCTYNLRCRIHTADKQSSVPASIDNTWAKCCRSAAYALPTHLLPSRRPSERERFDYDSLM